MNFTIQAQWESFFQQIGLAQALPARQTEMQHAFYAGAWAILKMQIAIGQLNQNAGIQCLNGLHEEIVQYADNLQGGSKHADSDGTQSGKQKPQA